MAHGHGEVIGTLQVIPGHEPTLNLGCDTCAFFRFC